MVRAGAPKRIWDGALEFEAYVRSHTGLGVDMLHGVFPGTMMLGVNSYIRQLYEHGLYY